MLSRWIVVLMATFIALANSDARAMIPLESLPTDTQTKFTAAKTELKRRGLSLDFILRGDRQGGIHPFTQAQIDRAAEGVQDPQFIDLIQDYVHECGFDLHSVVFYNQFKTSMYELQFDIARTNEAHIRYLRATVQRCREVKPYLLAMATAMAPTQVAIRSDLVVEGRFETIVKSHGEKMLNRELFATWQRRMREDRFRLALNELYENCGRKIVQVQLSVTNSIQGDILTLRIDGDIDEQLNHIHEVAATCKAANQELQDFNSRLAAVHKMHFTIDLSEVFDGHANLENLGTWVRYFEAQPSRLDKLRRAYLDAFDGTDMEDLNKCASPGIDPCGTLVVAFAHEWRIHKRTSALPLLELAPFMALTTGYRVLPEISTGLKVTDAPHIPVIHHN